MVLRDQPHLVVGAAAAGMVTMVIWRLGLVALGPARRFRHRLSAVSQLPTLPVESMPC
jgi:hypothetical protein